VESAAEDDSPYVSDSDESDGEETILTPEQKKKADRTALLERLAKAYEDEQSKGCIACSS
jgi:hypothetical protein